MTDLSDIWSRLSTDGELREGFVRLRLGDVASCRAYAARNTGSGLEAVMFELPTAAVPVGIEYPDPAGLSLRPVPVVAGPKGRTRVSLAVTEAAYQDIFPSLAADVVEALKATVSGNEVLRVLVTRLSRWQRLLEEQGVDGLSVAAQRGLVGELMLLRDHVLSECSPDAALAAWQGPVSADQDFQFEFGRLEVKTSTANEFNQFRVSSVVQLAPPDALPLFVALVHLVEDAVLGQTLPDVVESLRQRFDEVALSIFEERLFDVGYLDCHASKYTARRYLERATSLFAVDDGFPRLLRATLPVGVEDVNYSVSVASIRPYEVDVASGVSQLVSPAIGDT